MKAEHLIEELRGRLQLAQGATLVLAVVADDGVLVASRDELVGILRTTPMNVADLGMADVVTGPSRWAEQTQNLRCDAAVIAFAPPTPIQVVTFARLLNAERELLRSLRCPVLLLVSASTEQALRQHAPDFYTWVVQTYVVPDLQSLQRIAQTFGVKKIVSETPQDSIRFLHLSDLHLRPQPGKKFDQDRVLRGLFTFLERDRSEFPLDLIFITGDLAQSGAEAEYPLVIEFLEHLLSVTGVSKDHLFVVPGNHDVDRTVGQWLLRTLSGDQEAINFFTEAANRRFHLQKHDAYRQHLGRLLGGHRPIGLAVGAEAVEFVEIRGQRLAIASFNSGWFAQGDDDHEKLWIGIPAVQGALDHIAEQDGVFAIALLHHPFGDLHPGERDDVEHYFARGFDLVLRGHLHSNKTRSIATERGGYVEVAAPAAYQGSQWPNGCFLGEIAGNRVRLRPYMYTSGPDPWVIDTKVFPDDEAQGHCRVFQVPAKRRSKAGALRRAAAAAVVREIPKEERAEMAEELLGAPTMFYGQGLAQVLLEGGWESNVAFAEKLFDAVFATELLAHRHAPLPLETITDFDNVLRDVGRLVLHVVVKLGVGFIPGHLLERHLASAFGVITGNPIETQRLVVSEGTTLRVDIALNDPIKTERPVALIEVKVSARGNVTKLQEDGIRQMGQYLDLLPARFGALILHGALPQGTLEPQIDYRKVSEIPVLIMRI